MRQRLEIGEITAKEYRTMAELPDHQFPRQEVNEGQKHGYVGIDEDEHHDRPAGGWSNAPTEDAATKKTAAKRRSAKP